jgi:hypothetical protein
MLDQLTKYGCGDQLMFMGRLLVRPVRKNGKVKRLVVWKIPVHWNPYILCWWHLHSRSI